MKRSIALVLVFVITGCTGKFAAEQIGPMPPNYEEQISNWFLAQDIQPDLHHMLEPTLTDYGWLTCVKLKGKTVWGGLDTRSYFFNFRNGRLLPGFAKEDPYCYRDYEYRLGFWHNQL